MTVERLVVFVEEPSMEAALLELLPRILGATSFEIHPFQCKNALLQHLPQRLRAYAKWLPESWRLLVLVDQDDDDCRTLKAELEKIALDSGLVTLSRADDCRFQVINRIVVEELEAWYFGDWQAVHAAYPRVGSTLAAKAKYRSPDAIPGGTWEAFERILLRSGYFKTGLRKIEAARTITRHMIPERNTSPSFKAFFEALHPLKTE